MEKKGSEFSLALLLKKRRSLSESSRIDTEETKTQGRFGAGVEDNPLNQKLRPFS